MRSFFVLILVLTGSLITHSQPKRTNKGKAAVRPTNQSTASPATAGLIELPKCAAGSSLTANETSDLLAAHNRLRSEVKTTQLIWDCKLAAYAQEWAARGVAEHRETDLGENIFVSSDVMEPIKSVVERWVKEKDFWDNGKGVCQTGKICAHYTQTIWKTTAKVGCGINRSGTGKWKTIVVCNYDPVGNWPGPAY